MNDKEKGVPSKENIEAPKTVADEKEKPLSFSLEVKRELAAGGTATKTCCRKALAFGLLYGAQIDSACGEVRVSCSDPILADYTAEQIKLQFGKDPDQTEENRCGRHYWILSFRAKSAIAFFAALDREETTLSALIGMRCENCPVGFLRGVFLQSGSLAAPSGACHLEFLLRSANRAEKLATLMKDCGFSPKSINRRGGVGLYFKKYEAVEDFMAYLGANHYMFCMMNQNIERSLRSEENRATNCVTHNIARAVKGSFKDRKAVSVLRAAGRLGALPLDLQQTARLREEYSDLSILELAALHDPPISKSGCVHRLAKIRAESENIQAGNVAEKVQENVES